MVWGRAAPGGRPANNLLPLGSRGGQHCEGAKEVKLSHFRGGRESARKQVYIWRNEGKEQWGRAAPGGRTVKNNGHFSYLTFLSRSQRQERC